MIAEVVKASNETILLEDEEFVLVVDLFIFKPELQLQVTTGLEIALFYLNLVYMFVYLCHNWVKS